MAGTIYGFIGLGQMGQPMAANIARSVELHCFDKAGTQGRLPDGATAAESVAALAGIAQTIFLSLPDGVISRSVCQQIATVDSPATQLVVDLSTVGPTSARQANEILATAGIEYADAPVSGGRGGAIAATISLMWGGSTQAFEQHKTVLESFTGNAFHVGNEPGQGQALKLLNNFLSATAMAATSEAIHFGESQGLDMKTILDVVNVSSGQNMATKDKYLKRVLPGTYDAGFATGLMAKDVALFMEHVRKEKTPDTVGRVVEEIWKDCEQALGGQSDFSQIHQFTTKKNLIAVANANSGFLFT